MFGRGPQEAALREQAQRLGIESSVRFAGFRADLLEFLGHADLLVHPALREGLGICLLEAQAAGVPVVASHAGGIPEAVADGLTGMLVPPARPDELAAALVDLLGDAGKRHQLGAAGPDWVARNFSIERMVSGNLERLRRTHRVGAHMNVYQVLVERLATALLAEAGVVSPRPSRAPVAGLPRP